MDTCTATQASGCEGDGSSGRRPAWNEAASVDGVRCECEVIDHVALLRMEAHARGQTRTLRTTPQVVYVWSRSTGLQREAQSASCADTLRESVIARAREWSEHVRSVAAAPLDALRPRTLVGAC